MPLPINPAAEAAGLHPNWRKLHLGHIRQIRGIMRAPWNRARHPDYVRTLKTAQRSAAAARAVYRLALADSGVRK